MDKSKKDITGSTPSNSEKTAFLLEFYGNGIADTLKANKEFNNSTKLEYKK